ncbi:hypothetical protein H4S08_002889 [Coemansia sp. RSA 1365]|nr:hypothetical protein H4S08_002889 [Coemansia sp. RSA 1365]
MLKVDATAAGNGAVLLAHNVPVDVDDDVVVASENKDLRPIAYFSQVFDCAQGHHHSTWRKAKAIVEAVKHFHSYLNGCVNMRIESDALNVIELYSHKTANEANDLSCFRAELTGLGMMRNMLVHQAGKEQKTADWLS